MKISLIVSVYNIENYLLECLKSISNQTYSNLEVIIVDDGSKDASSEICDSFCETDSRFKTYHIQNKGLANSRKLGFEKSTGSVIGFIDGDDWLEETYCDRLLSVMIKESADIAVCNYFEDFEAKKNWEPVVLKGKKKIFQEYLQGEIYNRMWNKLYRREVVENTVFSVGRDNFEDGYWQPQALAASNIVVRISDCLYHYRIRPGSLMQHKKTAKEISDIMLNQIFRLKILFENNNAIENNVLKKEYVNQIEEIILLARNLEEYDVLAAMQDMNSEFSDIIYRDKDPISAGLSEVIKKAENTGELYKNYWKLIFSSTDIRTNLKQKLYRFIRFCYRYLKCIIN